MSQWSAWTCADDACKDLPARAMRLRRGPLSGLPEVLTPGPLHNNTPRGTEVMKGKTRPVDWGGTTLSQRSVRPCDFPSCSGAVEFITSREGDVSPNGRWMVCFTLGARLGYDVRLVHCIGNANRRWVGHMNGRPTGNFSEKRTRHIIEITLFDSDHHPLVH